MEVVKENIDDLNAIIRVKISEQDYQTKVEKELKRARQTAQIKGFRPGMAPKSLIQKMYGQGILIEELNKILSDSLSEFVEKSEQSIIGEPIPCDEKQEKIDWGTQKDYEFVYEVGYFPEVTLELNDNIELPFYVITPEEDEIDNEIKYYTQQYGKIEEVESSEEKDMIRATVDLSVLNTGEEGDEDHSNKTVSFLVNKISKDEQEKFLGKKVNDTITVEVRKVFENEHDLVNMLGISKEELENIPTELTFTINSITRLMPSKLNQELFDKICGEGKVQTEEEFREHLTNNAKEYYTKLGTERLGFDAQEVLLEKVGTKLPEDFIKRLILFLNRDTENFNEELLNKELPAIVKDLAWQNIQDTLLKKFDVKVEYEEILEQARATVISRLRQYGLHNFEGINLDGIVENTLKNREELDSIIKTLKFVKLSGLLKDKVKLLNKEVSLEEYNKLFKDENEVGEVNDPESTENTTEE